MSNDPRLQAGFAAEADSSWRDQAACQYVDSEIFFPDRGGSSQAAKRICNGWVKDGVVKIPPCPVRAECLAYALATDQRHGIFGGMSERQRAALTARHAPVKRYRCDRCGMLFDSAAPRMYCSKGCRQKAYETRKGAA